MAKDITIKEAARLAGVSRQTIYNKIDKGELSRNNDKRIDLSEFLRVYPDAKIDTPTEDNKNVQKQKSVKNEVSNRVLVDTNKNIESVKDIEIKYLKQQLEIMSREVDNVSKERDDWKNQAQRLLPAPKAKKGVLGRIKTFLVGESGESE